MLICKLRPFGTFPIHVIFPPLAEAYPPLRPISSRRSPGQLAVISAAGSSDIACLLGRRPASHARPLFGSSITIANTSGAVSLLSFSQAPQLQLHILSMRVPSLN